MTLPDNVTYRQLRQKAEELEHSLTRGADSWQLNSVLLLLVLFPVVTILFTDLHWAWAVLLGMPVVIVTQLFTRVFAFLFKKINDHDFWPSFVAMMLTLGGLSGLALGLTFFSSIFPLLLLLGATGLASAALFPLGRRKQGQKLNEWGLGPETIELLVALPDQLPRQIHGVMNASVADYCDLQRTIVQKLDADSSIDSDGLRWDAEGTFRQLLHQAQIVVKLNRRLAQNPRDEDTKQRLERAAAHSKTIAAQLNKASNAAMEYVAMQRQHHAAELDEKAEYLKLIVQSQKELDLLAPGDLED